MVLCGQGKLEPAQDDATISVARPRTERLNLHLIHKARGSADISNLASPVTGGGVPVTRSSQLFALATTQGHQDPAACARYVLDLLPAQAAPKDGKGRAPDAEQLAKQMALLTQQAREFFDKQRPVLRALQVI